MLKFRVWISCWVTGCFIIFSGAVRTVKNGRTAPMLRISAKEATTINISKRLNWVRRLFDIWSQRRESRLEILDITMLN